MNIFDYDVSASNHYISINGDRIIFQVPDVDGFPNEYEWDITWSPLSDIFYFDIFSSPTQNLKLEKSEENFTKYCKPLIQFWEVEHAKVVAKEEAEKEEFLSLDMRKKRALSLIQSDYETSINEKFVRSSMGFDADISYNSSASLNGTWLNLTQHEKASPRTTFRDYYGKEHQLTVDQVKMLICEINDVQNNLREQKYKFKKRVEEATDNEELNKILETSVYTTFNFQQIVNGTPTEIPLNEGIMLRVDHI